MPKFMHEFGGFWHHTVASSIQRGSHITSSLQGPLACKRLTFSWTSCSRGKSCGIGSRPATPLTASETETPWWSPGRHPLQPLARPAPPTTHPPCSRSRTRHLRQPLNAPRPPLDGTIRTRRVAADGGAVGIGGRVGRVGGSVGGRTRGAPALGDGQDGWVVGNSTASQLEGWSGAERAPPPEAP